MPVLLTLSIYSTDLLKTRVPEQDNCPPRLTVPERMV